MNLVHRLSYMSREKHDQINRKCYTNYEKIVKNNTFWANLEQRKLDNTFGKKDGFYLF
jgi:hypothetical protein